MVLEQESIKKKKEPNQRKEVKGMENKVEKKIYNGWAFSENEREKGKMNYEIYKELKEKYKIKQLFWNQSFNNLTKEELDKYDIIYSREAKYCHAIYTLYKKPEGITENELLLIFDDGNLCFGGCREYANKYRVSED